MKQSLVTKGISCGVVAVAIVVALFPIAWMLSISLRLNSEVFSIPPQWLPSTFTLTAYATDLQDARMLRYLANSYFVAMAVSLLSLVIAALAGYAFSRYRFAGSGIAQLFVLSTQMIPPIVLILPYFAFLVSLHLQNTLTGLVVTYVSFALPFSILMLTRYFNTVPVQLDEAAQIDGASVLVTLWRVVLPLSIPGIVATFVYCFMLSWNEFLFATTLLQSSDSYTFPMGIAFQVTDVGTSWNRMIAYAIIGTVPIVIGFFIAQRQLVQGLTSGSVRG